MVKANRATQAEQQQPHRDDQVEAHLFRPLQPRLEEAPDVIDDDRDDDHHAPHQGDPHVGHHQLSRCNVHKGEVLSPGEQQVGEPLRLAQAECHPHQKADRADGQPAAQLIQVGQQGHPAPLGHVILQLVRLLSVFLRSFRSVSAPGPSFALVFFLSCSNVARLMDGLRTLCCRASLQPSPRRRCSA